MNNICEHKWSELEENSTKIGDGWREDYDGLQKRYTDYSILIYQKCKKCGEIKVFKEVDSRR